MTPAATSPVQDIESVIVRFSGDSGDGMQLTGTQFTNASAMAGNDISTLPDFPAEIRAPAGTLAGVSGFQVALAATDIFTPGDAPDVLVAMNPAALAANVQDLKPGGVLIVNEDTFTPKNLKRAHLETNPLEDGSLDKYRVHRIPLTSLNRAACEGLENLSTKDVDRTKNFFALGLAFWMYDRPLEPTYQWIADRFARTPSLVEANLRAFKAGYNFGDTTETFQCRYRIRPAKLPPGVYRKVTGNEALAMGLVTAARRADKTLFYGSYPITPASDILHYLAALRHFNVMTFQAEDEIAAMGSIIGAAFGGSFACTASSGPGIVLKSEAMNLALVLELPVVIVNVQRGGPSTGLPTKPEQSDLLMAYFGRNGESPVPIIAPATPADCFTMAIEAFRLAVRCMSPVILLSDGYLANSSEPWRIPNPDLIAPIKVDHPTRPKDFAPYRRDPETMGRPWVIPGTKGMEHRVGGLAKEPVTGNVSYKPEHHRQMVQERQEKVSRLAEVIPEQTVFGPGSGDLLVVGWGSTFGAIRSAVELAQAEGHRVATTHLRYLNPFPRNLESILKSYRKILLPELNLGQLALLLRGKFGVDIRSFPKVEGRPFKITEIHAKIIETLQGGE
ncbi:MAG: 2-oxoacid:acceptor oxidoreductase subunit alpha [Armatimonadetes bacterium]|nr:2-oxoacid:acceptor oxidoreductase subunit alpha [Armatimonadota bacterium]